MWRYDQIVNNAGCMRYMSGGLINCPHRHPRPGKRRHQCRRDPFAHAGESSRQRPRPESRLPRHRLRRQGPDENGHPRQRPGHVHGEHAALRRAMGGARGGISHPARLGRCQARRQPRLADCPRARGAHLPEGCRDSSAEHDIDAEVVDLRSIRPLDEETILQRCARRIAPCWWRRTSPSAASTPRSRR